MQKLRTYLLGPEPSRLGISVFLASQIVGWPAFALMLAGETAALPVLGPAAVVLAVASGWITARDTAKARRRQSA